MIGTRLTFRAARGLKGASSHASHLPCGMYALSLFECSSRVGFGTIAARRLSFHFVLLTTLSSCLAPSLTLGMQGDNNNSRHDEETREAVAS